VSAKRTDYRHFTATSFAAKQHRSEKLKLRSRETLGNRHARRSRPLAATNPEDIDLGAIKADLEFLIERVERFRREQALRPLYVMVGGARIVIARIELFWRALPVTHRSPFCREQPDGRTLYKLIIGLMPTAQS
jgi:hypothetical protein